MERTGRLQSCLTPIQTFKIAQSSYPVPDPWAAYQLDKHWRAALSVNNIFDRVYFQTVALPSAGDWYGEPRNYRLRLNATF